MNKALLLLAFPLLFTACAKEKSTVTPESLVIGQWKLSAYKITVPQLGNLGQFDLLDTLATCKRDDLTEFTAEHTLFYDEGAVKCNEADSQRTYQGNWQLAGNNAELQLTKNPTLGDLTFKINELSASTLHLSKDTTVKTGGLNFAGTVDLIYRR